MLSAHHIHFNKTMHDIFFGFSEVKKCVSVVKCKVKVIKGSLNKINKFIFNKMMRLSSVKSRKIIRRQTGLIEISSFKFMQNFT